MTATIHVREQAVGAGRPLWTCLQPTDPLPAVCARHGRPAVAYRNATHTFRFIIFSKDLPESSAANFLLRAMSPRGAPTRFRSRSQAMPDAELTCDWPLCGRCRTRYRCLQLGLVAALVTTAVGLFASILTMTTDHASASEAGTNALLAFLLGVSASILIGADFSRLAVNAGKLRLSPTFDAFSLSAHPAFAEALPSVGSPHHRANQPPQA